MGGYTDCGSTANLYSAETQEGDREGGDVRYDVADYHHFFWVLGYEFGGHFCVDDLLLVFNSMLCC
jgi:hypothetical protein